MGEIPLARRHHFVPQGYLAAFTDTGTRKGHLTVFDKINRRSYRTTPKNVATRRDFNRIEVDGQPPDAIEKQLAELEDRVIQAVRRILESRSLDDEGDLEEALYFVTLLVVRNPELRSTFNEFRTNVAHMIAELAVSSEATWRAQLEKMRKAGIDFPQVSYRDAKSFVDERRYTVEFGIGSNLGVELSSLTKMSDVIRARSWTLLLAPERGPDFISCDHPVILEWKDGMTGPVGFGCTRTEMFVPLSPRAGLYGTFEDPRPRVVSADIIEATQWNAAVFRHANRQVFSARGEIVIYRDGRIGVIDCKIHAGRPA